MDIGTDPSFCTLHMPSPSPDARLNMGLVDVHRVSGRFRIAPKSWMAAAGWRDTSQLVDALVAYLLASAAVAAEGIFVCVCVWGGKPICEGP